MGISKEFLGGFSSLMYSFSENTLFYFRFIFELTLLAVHALLLSPVLAHNPAGQRDKSATFNESFLTRFRHNCCCCHSNWFESFLESTHIFIYNSWLLVLVCHHYILRVAFSINFFIEIHFANFVSASTNTSSIQHLNFLSQCCSFSHFFMTATELRTLLLYTSTTRPPPPSPLHHWFCRRRDSAVTNTVCFSKPANTAIRTKLQQPPAQQQSTAKNYQETIRRLDVHRIEKIAQSSTALSLSNHLQ